MVSGPLFTIGTDALPPYLVRSRSREIGYYNYNCAAAEIPVKFQGDWKNLNPNHTASRLHEILHNKSYCLTNRGLGLWSMINLSISICTCSHRSGNGIKSAPKVVKGDTWMIEPHITIFNKNILSYYSAMYTCHVTDCCGGQRENCSLSFVHFWHHSGTSLNKKFSICRWDVGDDGHIVGGEDGCRMWRVRSAICLTLLWIHITVQWAPDPNLWCQCRQNGD